MIQKIWFWVLYSSQDPTKISLSLKGALMLGISYAIPFLPLIGTDQETLTGIANSLVMVVQGGLTVIGGVAFLWGAVRKVVNTFRAN